MYLGPVSVPQNQYADRWHPGLGTYSVSIGVVQVEHHRYVCDHCGAAVLTLHEVVEPFYCHSAACEGVKLIGIA